MSENNLHPFALKITAEERASRMGQAPKVIWFTGLSGAGKTTLAMGLEASLWQQGYKTYLLDGDNMRTGLNKDLDFSEAGRRENIRRIGEVARLFLDAGMVVLCAFISPYRAERDLVKTLVGSDNFLEVYVSTPLEICELRDVKGLYQKARSGLLKNFTGIDAPYEAPEAPFLQISTHLVNISEAVEQVTRAVAAQVGRPA